TTWGDGVDGFSPQSPRSFLPKEYHSAMNLGPIPNDYYSDYSFGFDNYWADYAITYGSKLSERPPEPPRPTGFGAHNDAFVARLCRRRLGRNPGRHGLQYSAGRIASGMTPARVAQAIGDSPEHKALLNSQTAPSISLARSSADAVRAGIQAKRTSRRMPLGGG